MRRQLQVVGVRRFGRAAWRQLPFVLLGLLFGSGYAGLGEMRAKIANSRRDFAFLIGENRCNLWTNLFVLLGLVAVRYPCVFLPKAFHVENLGQDAQATPHRAPPAWGVHCDGVFCALQS